MEATVEEKGSIAQKLRQPAAVLQYLDCATLHPAGSSHMHDTHTHTHRGRQAHTALHRPTHVVAAVVGLDAQGTSVGQGLEILGIRA